MTDAYHQLLKHYRTYAPRLSVETDLRGCEGFGGWKPSRLAIMHPTIYGLFYQSSLMPICKNINTGKFLCFLYVLNNDKPSVMRINWQSNNKLRPSARV